MLFNTAVETLGQEAKRGSLSRLPTCAGNAGELRKHGGKCVDETRLEVEEIKENVFLKIQRGWGEHKSEQVSSLTQSLGRNGILLEYMPFPGGSCLDRWVSISPPR